ncbi:cytidine deaminase [Larsenimonas suaedae]|uniref:Cytidine deaminase n=1 Tax=Larsenimonas suaedae TaxID=1851019 RepID=A0ABU1GY86_9GAMM|nr:cytidine deaminase [Larsenimonas suaedae]MCM2973400.1 cytidine deaminase [Larsenimonas suaedae]MDR5896293.1 cytidine deaminase [Larsenimonas suaedae]
MSVSHTEIQCLITARNHAYTPYSNHPVAALVEDDQGRQFTGCNVEIANYKGLCAEASAIASMVSQTGSTTLARVVVMGPGEALCTPCGDCRQRIREFATVDTEIVVVSGEGEVLKRYSMEALLPDSFGPENLPD